MESTLTLEQAKRMAKDRMEAAKALQMERLKVKAAKEKKEKKEKKESKRAAVVVKAPPRHVEPVDPGIADIVRGLTSHRFLDQYSTPRSSFVSGTTIAEAKRRAQEQVANRARLVASHIRGGHYFDDDDLL